MERETAADIDDAAARWAARKDRADWRPGDEAELARWLASDPRRKGAFLRAQAVYSMLDDPGVWCELPEAQAEAPRFVTRRRFLAFGMAGVAASAAGLTLITRRPTFETQVGEIRSMPLKDGSTAVINTASQISLDFSPTRRGVTLAKGEVWFQVAKDRSRPFVVDAGRLRVEAIGTAFSVWRHDGGARLLVSEGVVRAWLVGTSVKPVTIDAGSGIIIGADTRVASTHDEYPIVDRALAWRQGKIDLAGRTLESAAAEFNRYNERKLVIRDPALADEQFDGVFRTGDPVGFAEVVEASLDVPVDFSNATEIRIGEGRLE